MKFLLSFISITLLFTSLLHAQGCGSFATPADVIREKQRRYKHQNQRVSASSTPLHFAVKFHIVTESDSSGAPDYSLIVNAYEALNKTFAKINVVFDTCSGSSYIADSQFYNFDASSQQDDIAALYDSANVINVYIVGTLWYGATEELCGIVSQIYSYPSTNRLFVAQQCLPPYITLTHEMGHYFGLYHTFETGIGGVEDPNESNCSRTGDLLCDTPSDPNGSINNLCQYLGPDSINYMGSYQRVHPLVDNIMSYYKVYGSECRTSFTPDQYSEMTGWALNYQGQYPCPPPHFPPPPVLTIKIFPVPADNSLTVGASNANFPLAFRIVDVTGKVVYQNSLTETISQIDISGLPSGMYITQVMDSNKSLFIKKIIKVANQ